MNSSQKKSISGRLEDSIKLKTCIIYYQTERKWIFLTVLFNSREGGIKKMITVDSEISLIVGSPERNMLDSSNYIEVVCAYGTGESIDIGSKLSFSCGQIYEIGKSPENRNRLDWLSQAGFSGLKDYLDSRISKKTYTEFVTPRYSLQVSALPSFLIKDKTTQFVKTEVKDGKVPVGNVSSRKEDVSSPSTTGKPKKDKKKQKDKKKDPAGMIVEIGGRSISIPDQIQSSYVSVSSTPKPDGLEQRYTNQENRIVSSEISFDLFEEKTNSSPSIVKSNNSWADQMSEIDFGTLVAQPPLQDEIVSSFDPNLDLNVQLIPIAGQKKEDIIALDLYESRTPATVREAVYQCDILGHTTDLNSLQLLGRDGNRTTLKVLSSEKSKEIEKILDSRMEEFELLDTVDKMKDYHKSGQLTGVICIDKDTPTLYVVTGIQSLVALSIVNRGTIGFVFT
jgi:hypothetical protein